MAEFGEDFGGAIGRPGAIRGSRPLTFGYRLLDGPVGAVIRGCGDCASILRWWDAGTRAPSFEAQALHARLYVGEQRLSAAASHASGEPGRRKGGHRALRPPHSCETRFPVPVATTPRGAREAARQWRYPEAWDENEIVRADS